MPQHQLPVAISLSACALFSAAVFALAKPDDGKVKLPEIARDATSKDPFDVTTPEDIVDGEPIDEARFWSRVCTVYVVARLTFICVLLDAATQIAAHISLCCNPGNGNSVSCMVRS